MSSRVIKSRKKYLTPAGLSVCTRVTIGLVKNWKYKDKIKINKIKKIKEKKMVIKFALSQSYRDIDILRLLFFY